MADQKGSYDTSGAENNTKTRTLPENCVLEAPKQEKKSVLTNLKEKTNFSKLSTEKKVKIIVAVLAVLCVILFVLLLNSGSIFGKANDDCSDRCPVEEPEAYSEKGIEYTENPGCEVMKIYKSDAVSYINRGLAGVKFPIYLFSCKYPKGDFLSADFDGEITFEDLVDKGEKDAFGNYTGHHQESGLSGTKFYLFGAFDENGTCHGIIIIEDELYNGSGLYPKLSTKAVTNMCGCDYIGTVNKYFIENYEW